MHIVVYVDFTQTQDVEKYSDRMSHEQGLYIVFRGTKWEAVGRLHSVESEKMGEGP